MSEKEIIPESGEVSQSKLYIGDKKVKSYKVSKENTPTGGRVIDIVYLDDSLETLAEANFDAVKGYQKADATKRQNKLVKVAGMKIYALLMEYGPTLAEVNKILNEGVRLADDATEEAMNSLWGVDNLRDRTILHVNAILSKKYESEPKKETSSDGASPERSGADIPDKE